MKTASRFLKGCALFLAASTVAGATKPALADAVSAFIFSNTVFDQTSNSAPASPAFYFFSVGAAFQTAGDYSTATATYPAGSQALSLIAPTEFNFGSSVFATLGAMQAAYPFGTYTVTANGSQPTSTSSLNYLANFFTTTIPSVTNFSSLSGLNPANSFTVNYNSFTPDANVTTGFTFFTISNDATHQVVFSDGFQSASSIAAVIAANTLAPNTKYDFELDFSNRLLVGTTTQGFDMRTDGSFTTGAAVVPVPIAGAGLPGLIMGGAGLLGWWRRKRKAEAAA